MVAVFTGRFIQDYLFQLISTEPPDMTNSRHVWRLAFI